MFHKYIFKVSVENVSIINKLQTTETTETNLVSCRGYFKSSRICDVFEVSLRYTLHSAHPWK